VVRGFGANENRSKLCCIKLESDRAQARGAWVTESFNYAVAALPAMFSRVTPALAVTLGRKPSRRCGA